MKKVIELKDNATNNFKDRDKLQTEKFMVSLALGDSECLKILNSYGVVLTKSSQFIVLTQDAKTLTQELELAKKMDFLDAYKTDPKRLCQAVTNVIKRMAKCDAMGVSYKKEDGRFENFIFSERMFNARLTEVGIKNQEIVAPAPDIDFNQSEDIDKIKEYALRVLEQFAMPEQKEAVYKRIDEIKGSNLGTKEMLMEAFKVCGGNTEILSSTIDELLEQEENMSLGRAA